MSTPDLRLAPGQPLKRAYLSILGFQFELRVLRAVSAAYFSTRLLIFFIIFISSVAIPMRAGDYPYSTPSNMLIDGLVRDDSWWYTNIVTQGYRMGNIETGEQGNVAFFPLYPALIKMAAAITGNIFLAGILVSNVAFFVALAYLYLLTRAEFDEEIASRTIFYLAAAPTAVFFSAMYTESVYIALVCATFYYSRRGRWDWAALTGALAAATRNTGILLALVIVLECLHQRGVRFRPAKLFGQSRAETLQIWGAHLRQQIRPALASWRGLAAAACVPLGLIAYMAYLANKFGDPLAFIHVQATWGRSTSPAGIMNIVGNVKRDLNIGANFWAGQVNHKTLLDLIATLGFGILAIGVARKMRPAHAAFVALTILVPLSTGTVGSMTRYILMLVPCFMLLAVWGQRQWVDRLVLGVFLPLSAFFTIMFSHWYFAG